LKLGILGGTFDPIHVGHLAAAHAAIECAGLDRVLFVPSAEPPHRTTARATGEQRLEMCRLALAGDSRFGASDVEIRRGGLSYTVDTLRELVRAYPGDELYLILGWDAAKLFKTWREPEIVTALARIIVVSRPGTSEPDAERLSAAGLDPGRTVSCRRPTPNVSASALRHALASGTAIAGQVPEAVARYIASHRLYADNR
jgi:nicotinate-nucleotide adenylyltransferase